MKGSISQKNYYALLGLHRDATDLEIQVAYSDLSRIYDPESRFFADIIDDPITPEQVEVFNLINLAYETLIDQNRRKEYDQQLAEEH